MKRFEYQTISFQEPHGGHSTAPPWNAVVAKLNELGAEGWHVVESNFAVWLLEREIEQGS